MGYLPLFKFYHSDQFSHLIEAAFLIPADDEYLWRLQSSIGASFRGFSGGILNLTNTFVLREKADFYDSFLINWTVPVKSSLLGVFYSRITAAYLKRNTLPGLTLLLRSPYEQLRSETLEVTLERNENNFRMCFVLGHEAIIRIQGRLNFTGFAKLRYNEDIQMSVSTFDALIGTTLRVSF